MFREGHKRREGSRNVRYIRSQILVNYRTLSEVMSSRGGAVGTSRAWYEDRQSVGTQKCVEKLETRLI